jgi:hemoglobin
MEDIRTFEDIVLLVDEFYGKVRADHLLGPIFEEKIGDRWDKHLDTMYRFWQTILLEEGQTYFGNPFMKHAPLPIFADHFERWLALWKETLESHFSGPLARDAYDRATKMAYVFQVKLDHIRAEGGRPLF